VETRACVGKTSVLDPIPTNYRGYNDMDCGRGWGLGLLDICSLDAPEPGGFLMKKTMAGLLAAATIALTFGATATDASAYWRGRGWGYGGGWHHHHRGWGWGPGVAAGIVGGAVIAGAIIATRPPGYVVYSGYPEPVYGPGCYWAAQPVYDGWGRVAGYGGPPVQVCPGYVAGPPPPPVAVAPYGK
jgi:hypothetical protein